MDGGLLCPVWRELGPHLTQCGLGRGLLPYQVASWSIEPFGHNRHRQKIGDWAPFGGAGSLYNTMWPGPRPTSVSSFALIHPTVWPQYTNVTDKQTDKQDRQARHRSDSIGRTVLQTVAQKRLLYQSKCRSGCGLGLAQGIAWSCLSSLACRDRDCQCCWFAVNRDRSILSSVHTIRVYGPCSRAVSTAREHGCYFGHPCSRAMDTGVILTPVFTGRTGVQNDARVNGPCPRSVNTAPVYGKCVPSFTHSERPFPPVTRWYCVESAQWIIKPLAVHASLLQPWSDAVRRANNRAGLYLCRQTDSTWVNEYIVSWRQW